jgi:hypothetical protein
MNNSPWRDPRGKQRVSQNQLHEMVRTVMAKVRKIDRTTSSGRQMPAHAVDGRLVLRCACCERR